MQFINTCTSFFCFAFFNFAEKEFVSALIVIFITFLCALADSPVFAMPARNVTGGIQAIAARQDDLPADPIIGLGGTPKPTMTKSKRPRPTSCGPNMKRQEGEGAGLKIVPVCD